MQARQTGCPAAHLFLTRIQSSLPWPKAPLVRSWRAHITSGTEKRQQSSRQAPEQALSQPLFFSRTLRMRLITSSSERSCQLLKPISILKESQIVSRIEEPSVHKY